MNNHALLISIRPRFAEMIFAGSKTVELRRVCPRISSGDLALVYVSSPTKELQGAFEVGKVISATPSVLWRKIGKKSGITRAEFFAYFQGKTEAHALVIKRAWKLPVSICLTNLRRRKGGFRPPQSFHYLKRNESSLLTVFAVAQNN
jgi:predicted transcriptional regulator